MSRVVGSVVGLHCQLVRVAVHGGMKRTRSLLSGPHAPSQARQLGFGLAGATIVPFIAIVDALAVVDEGPFEASWLGLIPAAGGGFALGLALVMYLAVRDRVRGELAGKLIEALGRRTVEWRLRLMDRLFMAASLLLVVGTASQGSLGSGLVGLLALALYYGMLALWAVVDLLASALDRGVGTVPSGPSLTETVRLAVID